MDFDLGFFDQEEGRVEPAPNPFEPTNVLTISPGPCEVAEGQSAELASTRFPESSIR